MMKAYGWERINGAARKLGMAVVLWAVLAAWSAAQDAAPAVQDARDYSGDLLLNWPPFPHEVEATTAVFIQFADADRKAISAFIREHFSADLKRFKVLVLDPATREEAKKLFAELVRDSIDLMDLQRRDSEEFEAELREKKLAGKARELAESIRRASGEERVAAEDRLEALLGHAFELKQDRMCRDVARLQQQLQDLEDLVNRRREHREAIVSGKVAELLGETDHLRW